MRERVSLKALTALFIAWMAYLLSFIDRLSWPPIMPLASKDLAINSTQAGGLMTAFYIGYVITQFPGGLLVDRYGYRKVLLTSFLAMGSFTLFTGFAHSYEQAFLVRVLVGIGSGAIFSSSVSAIFDWFPENRRGTAMGLFMTSTSLGVFVVNLFVPTVAEEYGWRAAFYVSGTLPLIALIFAYFFLKERTPVSQRLKEKSRVNVFQDTLSLFKNRNLMIAGLAGFCALWGTWGTATWANTYLNQSLELPLVQAGAIMSLYGVAGLLCKPIIGIISDYVNRTTILFCAFLLFAPTLLWFGLNQNVSLLYFLTPVLGVTAFVYSPVMNTLIGQLVDKRLVGTATGFVNTIWQLGSLLSPLAVGAVIDATSNYFLGFAMLAAGPALAAIIISFIKMEKSETVINQETEQSKLSS
ncbi:MFS transporter [Peribacillus sp. S4]|uniref:MFS transporter n=1 Tax=Peribacillus sp. S4 TaxID=3384451 RepID=UPI00398920FE